MSASSSAKIMIVRHGQSAGNVAREAAEAAGLSVIATDRRDVDVPLSTLGYRQATALGDWMAQQPVSEWPEVVLVSPYVRAQETAITLLSRLSTSGAPPVILSDERLREREFGGIEGLTRKGIIERFPREAELYDSLGKFYYRPPGGESWCDVILRLRSVVESLSREHAGKRVLIVCHTVVVFCLRYLIEGLTEKEILALDRGTRLANCSLTTYRAHSKSDNQLRNNFSLEAFNFVAPLEEAGEKITTAPDKAKPDPG